VRHLHLHISSAPLAAGTTMHCLGWRILRVLRLLFCLHLAGELAPYRLGQYLARELHVKLCRVTDAATFELTCAPCRRTYTVRAWTVPCTKTYMCNPAEEFTPPHLHLRVHLAAELTLKRLGHYLAGELTCVTLQACQRNLLRHLFKLRVHLAGELAPHWPGQ
jgi:hypothetical protein